MVKASSLYSVPSNYFSRKEGETPATCWTAEGRNLSKTSTLDCTLGVVSCVNLEHTEHIEWVQIQRNLYVLKQCLIDKHFMLRASFCCMKFMVFIMTEGDTLR